MSEQSRNRVALVTGGTDGALLRTIGASADQETVKALTTRGQNRVVRAVNHAGE
jgi:hypothetical protein